MKLPIIALIVLVPSAVAGPTPQEPDDLVPPAVERGPANVKLDLPAVPAFEGTGSVKELRVAGSKLMDSTVTVHGVVTFAYSCPHIDDDPTQCERPKFYVGDTAQTPPEQSLWVVDVPRPYNKLELRNIQKAERTMPGRCEPSDKNQKICPPYKVGDVVTVSGDFKITSPHAESNSDGLLVYQAMNNETRHWQSAGSTWPATNAEHTFHSAYPQRPQVPRLAQTKPMRDVVAPTVRDESRAHLAAGTKAFGLKQFDSAIDEYGKALAWSGNHVAYYGLGGVHAARGEWSEAIDAFEHAVALRPDVAMYQMWLGVAQYEKIEKAAQQGAGFDKPLVHLLLAAQLAPDLWRAHYYLGRIDRESAAWKAAAEDFSAAIRANPRMPAPYIALAEIYRRWDYLDDAIAVAEQGAMNVPSPDGASDLWFELGMGFDAKRQDDRAIEAFTKAIETRKDNPRALFQRGQAYFHKGDRANAKRDLEAVVKSQAPGLDLVRQTASALLMELAAKK